MNFAGFFLVARKYDRDDISGIPFDLRSPVCILAHIFFLAKHGATCTRSIAPAICVAGVEAIRERGAR